MGTKVKLEPPKWMENSPGIGHRRLKDLKIDKGMERLEDTLQSFPRLKGRFTYHEMQETLNETVALMNEMSKFIPNTLHDIGRIIDDPFYQEFNGADGIMEMLEHTNIENYTTRNTLELKQQKFEFNDKTGTEMYVGFADQTPYLTLDQLYNGEYGDGRVNPLKQIYKEPYEKDKSKLKKNTTYEDYIKMAIKQTDTHHTVDKGVMNVVSDVFDYVGITSLVGAVTGKNPFTGEKLTKKERNQAAINAGIDIVTFAAGFAGVAKGTKGVKAVTKVAGKHIVREVATGAVAGGTGLTVKHIAKENGASDTVAAVLGFTTSFATGYVLSMPKRNIKQTKQDPKIPVTGDDWENYFKSRYGEQYVTRKGTSGGKETIVSPEMETKILAGQRKNPLKNDVIGGHSQNVITDNNPKYAVEILRENSDGTKVIKYIAEFDDGAISKIKKSTVFPETWSDEKIINSIKTAGDSNPIGIRVRDGATLHRMDIDGVQVEVIKIGNDVKSSYPTGGGITGILDGFDAVN